MKRRARQPSSLTGCSKQEVAEPPSPTVNRVTVDSDDPTAHLAVWSEWTPLADALEGAPREPGVYMAREGATGPIVYVGSAGPRAGRNNDRRPQGIRGRLRVYTSGKALTSGLGEAVADRALADDAFLRERLAEVEAGMPKRASEWGRASVARANLYIRWATTGDKASAEELENACGVLLEGAGLWNRRRFAQD